MSEKFNRVKYWRGFGVLAVAFIVFWCYLLVVAIFNDRRERWLTFHL